MNERIFTELSAHYQDFQDVGAKGLRLLAESPLKGKYEIRHLQRAPILNAFEFELPHRLGSFDKVLGPYNQSRIVYHSDELNADLIFRRRGSVGMHARQHRRERSLQLAMFDQPERTFRGDLPIQAGLVWDMPKLDEDHQPVEPFPISLLIAKPGYKLDEREWSASYRLVELSETFPKTAELDPNELDWDIEADDEAQES